MVSFLFLEKCDPEPTVSFMEGQAYGSSVNQTVPSPPPDHNEYLLNVDMPLFREEDHYKTSCLLNRAAVGWAVSCSAFGFFLSVSRPKLPRPIVFTR